MKLKENAGKEAMELAQKYFLEDKNNCAEAVIRAIMRATDNECPLELVKLGSPFGRGMGEAGCVCGSLIGAQIALGQYFGRQEMSGPVPRLCGKASRMMHDRFRDRLGATCCRILHKGEPFGSGEQKTACAVRAGIATRLAVELVRELSAEKAEES